MSGTEPQFIVIPDADIVRQSENDHDIPLPSQDRAFKLNLCLCASDYSRAIAARGSICTVLIFVWTFIICISLIVVVIIAFFIIHVTLCL